MKINWVDISEDQAKSHPLYGTNKGWSLFFIIVLVLGSFRGGSEMGLAAKDNPELVLYMLVYRLPFMIWLWINAALLWRKSKKFLPSFVTYCAVLFCISVYEYSGQHATATAENAALAQLIAVVITSLGWLLYLESSKRIHVSIYHQVRSDDPLALKYDEPDQDEYEPTENESAILLTEEQIVEPIANQPTRRVIFSAESENNSSLSDSVEERLKRLKKLQLSGLISEDDAVEKRKRILEDL